MLQILFKFFTHYGSTFQRNFIILMISFVFVRFLDFKLVEFWSYLFWLDNFFVYYPLKFALLLALKSNRLFRTTFVHCFCLLFRVNLMGFFSGFVALLKNVEHLLFFCRRVLCIYSAFELSAFSWWIRSISGTSMIVSPTFFVFFIFFALNRNLLVKCLSYSSHGSVHPLIKLWRNAPKVDSKVLFTYVTFLIFLILEE